MALQFALKNDPLNSKLLEKSKYEQTRKFVDFKCLLLIPPEICMVLELSTIL